MRIMDRLPSLGYGTTGPGRRIQPGTNRLGNTWGYTYKVRLPAGRRISRLRMLAHILHVAPMLWRDHWRLWRRVNADPAIYPEAR